MGGLSKKAYQLEKLRQESPAPSLTLDGGALLFDSVKLPALRAAQTRATAEGIVEAYNLMGYDAAGVSRHDLAGGLPFLQEMASRSDFVWLSANLVNSRNRPIFKSHIIRKIGELTVAVTGLTAEKGADLEEAAVLPWQQVLPPLVDGLRDTADFIILLTDLPADKIQAITTSLPDIRLVIQAAGGAANLAPEPGVDTLICRTADQGKYLGILEIEWHGGNDRGWNQKELLLEKKRELDQLSWQLRRRPSSPDLEKKRLLLAKEIAVLENKGGSSSFTNRFLALPATLPDNPAVLAVTENIRKKIFQLGRQSSHDREKTRRDKSAASFPYVGWQACGECHQGQLEQWQQTRHAHAYQTLAARNQQFNLDCLPCHVTGHENADPEMLFPPVALQAVGCESCHGPGRQHARDPRQEITRKPAAEACLQCHTPERDDSFDYAGDLPRALHQE